MTNNKKPTRPTVIDGVAIPPGVRPNNATMSLVRDPKTGKASFKITSVGTSTTVTAGRTTIEHIPDGPYTPKETADINAARLRQGLPVLKTQQGFQHTVKVGLGEQPSELAKQLGAAANKPGFAAKAAKAYDAEAERRREEMRRQPSASVALAVRGPKMDK
jgi:hypothetical protein